MSDPVHPDQPYTPSEDEELRETIAKTLFMSRANYDTAEAIWESREPGSMLDREFESFAVALLPLIASVRRDAQADALEAVAEELASNTNPAGFGHGTLNEGSRSMWYSHGKRDAALQARVRAAAIRRNENGDAS